MHKTIPSTIAIIAIFFAVAVMGTVFWWTEKNCNRKDSLAVPAKLATKPGQPPVNEKDSSVIPDKEKPDTCSSSLPEFGDPANSGEKSILYGTRCIIEDSRMAYGGEYISRAYIRGSANGFNKKIFETKEQVLYASITGDNKDVISIRTSDSYGKNEKRHYFNKKGEKVDYEEKNERQALALPSPDKKFIANLPAPGEKEYRPPAVVKIQDVSSGKTAEYDLQKEVHLLNGIVINSWSPDSRYLYVTGGIYEFFAPAKLWRIDVEKGKVKTYALDNLTFPVRVYPGYGVAFAAKSYESGMYDGNFVSAGQAENTTESKKITSLELYKIDLATGKISLFAREKALASFRNMFFNGKSVYYEATYGLANITDDSFRNQSVIKKTDLATEKNSLFSDDESHIQLFIPEENAMIMEYDKEMFYTELESGKQERFGDAHTPVNGANKTGVEYITRINGLVN